MDHLFIFMYSVVLVTLGTFVYIGSEVVIILGHIVTALEKINKDKLDDLDRV